VVHKGADGKSNVDFEPAKRQPTIQQLLTHTGGLSYDILPKSPDYPVRQMYLDAGYRKPKWNPGGACSENRHVAARE
ncbi:MAG TPA: hypothetical protein VE687_01590, partial [Stellaceae bacterium]|nr:hypothetical protein [Stellaceae bacterium]